MFDFSSMQVFVVSFQVDNHFLDAECIPQVYRYRFGRKHRFHRLRNFQLFDMMKTDQTKINESILICHHLYLILASTWCTISSHRSKLSCRLQVKKYGGSSSSVVCLAVGGRGRVLLSSSTICDVGALESRMISPFPDYLY